MMKGMLYQSIQLTKVNDKPYKEEKEMEFEGKISRVLPVRSGTSKAGNEFKALPFVFEYFEDDNQRTSDKVLLETNDQHIMAQIGAFLKKGADKKAVVENGECVMLGEIKCKIGFSHSVRQYMKKDGTQGLLNNIWIYRFEVLGAAVVQQQTQQAQVVQQMKQAQMQQQMPFATQQQGGDDDDLPF